jgi:hypothetical protein
VDLGLRLDSERPAGRLLPARNLGAATVRVALTRPDDVDTEVLGWLRRAYQENAAPPAPRRPARRPAPVAGTLTVVIEGFGLPGLSCRPDASGRPYRTIHVALADPRNSQHGRTGSRPALVVPGRPGLATEPVPGDAPAARREVPVTVRRDDAGFDFTGPFMHSDRAGRHLGLVWGEVPGDGTLRLFRGAKPGLTGLSPGLIRDTLVTISWPASGSPMPGVTRSAPASAPQHSPGRRTRLTPMPADGLRTAEASAQGRKPKAPPGKPG